MKPTWRRMMGGATVAMAVTTAAFRAQEGGSPAPPPAAVPQQAPPPAMAADARGTGLSDLDAMTFSCSKAALNAAAREASQVRSQGAYQFAYFRIVSDSHHASYEVHFRSNYAGEPELKYCVAVYCQQGWDPKMKTAVSLMGSPRQHAGTAAHAGNCDPPQGTGRKPKR